MLTENEAYREEHHHREYLRGRIITLPEGSQCSIRFKEDCKAYMKSVSGDPRLKGHIEAHEQMAFAKLHVRVSLRYYSSSRHINPRREQNG